MDITKVPNVTISEVLLKGLMEFRKRSKEVISKAYEISFRGFLAPSLSNHLFPPYNGCFLPTHITAKKIVFFQNKEKG